MVLEWLSKKNNKKQRKARAKICEYARVWGDSNVITLREEERINAMAWRGISDKGK